MNSAMPSVGRTVSSEQYVSARALFAIGMIFVGSPDPPWPEFITCPGAVAQVVRVALVRCHTALPRVGYDSNLLGNSRQRGGPTLRPVAETPTLQASWVPQEM